MTLSSFKFRLSAPFICSVMLGLLAATASDAQTYVYQEDDGTRWITDTKINAANFTYIDKYGRATATESCKGVTARLMERRAQKYRQHIETFAQQFNIDPILIKALIRAESCFDRRAISRAGARGLMQLMPATARSYGVLDRFDAENNIRAGVTHLHSLLVEFNGSKTRAIAAYNAGASAVKRYGGIPPYKETQTYVKRVLNFYEKYQSESADGSNTE